MYFMIFFFLVSNIFSARNIWLRIFQTMKPALFRISSTLYMNSLDVQLQDVVLILSSKLSPRSPGRSVHNNQSEVLDNKNSNLSSMCQSLFRELLQIPYFQQSSSKLKIAI